MNERIVSDRMPRIFKALAIIVLQIIRGCSNSIDRSGEESNEPKTTNSSFTGTIKEINGNKALVYAKSGGGEGNVFVDLSVNSDEVFRVGDKVKVGYDGTVRESSPAQINTLSVELIK